MGVGEGKRQATNLSTSFALLLKDLVVLMRYLLHISKLKIWPDHICIQEAFRKSRFM